MNVKANLYRRKLRNIFATTEQSKFFSLLWAIRILHTDKEGVARRFLSHIPAKQSFDRASRYAVHEWEIEAIASEYISFRGTSSLRGRRQLDCTRFDAFWNILIKFRKLSEAESAEYMPRVGVFSEIHRISHQQFHWQRGYFNSVHIYKYLFIYSGPKARDDFLSKYSISLESFVLVGLALYCVFQEQNFIEGTLKLDEIGYNSNIVDKAIAIYSRSLMEICQFQNNIDRPRVPVAYRKSALRQFPIIRFGIGRYYCPLPDLILVRFTDGLFYDFAGSAGQLRNEVSTRFELYAFNLTSHFLPKHEVSRALQYKIGSKNYETPDLLVSKDRKVSFVIECKTTRLSFEAQFSERPDFVAQRAYHEIARGVVQIWRFYSHLRLGKIETYTSGELKVGILLTLDPWLQFSSELRKKVIESAKEIAASDSHVEDIDMCEVIFSPIVDWEYVLIHIFSEEIEKFLSQAISRQFDGYMLSGIFDAVGKKRTDLLTFPFEMSEVIPWWDNLRPKDFPV